MTVEPIQPFLQSHKKIIITYKQSIKQVIEQKMEREVCSVTKTFKSNSHSENSIVKSSKHNIKTYK